MADSRGLGGSSRAGLLGVGSAGQIVNDDQLWNINAFEYLRNVYLAIIVIPQQGEIFRNFPSLQYLKSELEKNKDNSGNVKGVDDYPYGDLYSGFLTKFQGELEKALSLGNKERIQAVATVIDKIYRNQNTALERTAVMVSSKLGNRASHTSHAAEKSITNILKGTPKPQRKHVNKISPTTEGSAAGLLRSNFSALVTGGFSPQLGVNLAMVRDYDYKKFGEFAEELRICTQAESMSNGYRVNPLFEAWVLSHDADFHRQKNAAGSSSVAIAALAAEGGKDVSMAIDQAESTASIAGILAESNAALIPEGGKESRMRVKQSDIWHVYINNLGRDRDDREGFGQGGMEKRLTKTLEEFEQTHPGVVVITLPADKGLLDQHKLSSTEPRVNATVAFNQMLDVAMGNSNEKIKDFYISQKAKNIIYGNSDKEKEILTNLLLKSFNACGVTDFHSSITPSQFHAIYFHFIKYELTNYILNQIKPESFNISCKDAIDRGGAASAYYNLIKSIEVRNPMSEDEFFRAIHAAPAIAKGRGMNRHAQALWNAVNEYVKASKANKNAPPLPSWLPAWVANNKPSNNPQHYIDDISYIIEQEKESLQISGRRSSSSSLASSSPSLSLQSSTHGLFSTSPNVLSGRSQPSLVIEAAEKLINILSNRNLRLEFSEDEWNALERAPLKDIVLQIKNNNILQLDIYKPAASLRSSSSSSFKNPRGSGSS